jgi:hypothetical protein
MPLIVDEDETLIAGYAKPPFFALSSISAYWSGVAMGMGSPRRGAADGTSLSAAGGRRSAAGSLEGR